ncbi:LON peptidase substrate-binding domain-containing protein [Thalassotalea marina]|uniref:Peptidase S16 n=1 Tax=Thalassotalea marina TaxID=1673741 RepID=A0A919BNT5_9GAMM|nr:LON peptidase substrate-binding domain-containing protein [Thalassotalea marina]GHG03076.1 peptidase S16 [Thalassotalea marina]
MNLPVFPLPIFLLPDGVTRLRIFEPRYLKMVRMATQNQGFVVLLNDQKNKLFEKNWASWVEIINFDQDQDGLLLIDVKCKALVKLANITVDEDKLRHADVSTINHWPINEHDDTTEKLASSLLEVFEQNEPLNAMYQAKFEDKANWVVSRWLELLPVKLAAKSVFADAKSYEQAKQFVESIVLNEQLKVKS